MGPWTWTCLRPNCPPSAHITSAGGQIPMHWQQMHFLQDWTAMKWYANPPWNLVGRVLAQVQSQQVQVVLVAPV